MPALLKQKARVVVVSSVLHTYVDDAGPDYRYPSWPPVIGSGFGWWAYCRCPHTPVLCSVSTSERATPFYHNVLGIIGSSSASYDVTRGVPHYDATLDIVNRPLEASKLDTATGSRSGSKTGATDVSRSASGMKGVEGSGSEEQGNAFVRYESADDDDDGGASGGKGSNSSREEVLYRR